MKVAYNTGAPYTHLGQRITVELIPSEHCAVFYDNDRQIDALVPIPNPHCVDSPRQLAAWVQSAYINNQTTYAMYGTKARAAIELMKDLGYNNWVMDNKVVVVSAMDLTY